MKNKTIVAVILLGLATISFSFTFANRKGNETKVKQQEESSKQTEPIGGFVSESKL